MTAQAHRRPSIPCMDGIRGWACLLVMVTHAVVHNILPMEMMKLVWAKGAVIIFFALCGFMMMYHYYTEKQLSSHYWCAFGVRRFFRIYPPFVFTVLLYCFFDEHTGFNPDLIFNYLFLDFQELHASHLWTIPPEITFYALFPLLSSVLFISPFNHRGILLVTAIAALLLAQHHDTICMTIRNLEMEKIFTNNIQYFVAGMAAAYFHIHFPDIGKHKRQAWNVATWVMIVCMVLLIGMNTFFIPHGAYMTALRLHIIPFKMCTVSFYITFAVAGLLICAARSSGITHYIFVNPFVRYCGTISYSLYLIHPLIFALSSSYLPLDYLFLSVTGFSLAFIAAIAMHKTVENPSNMLGKKLSQSLMKKADSLFASHDKNP